MDVPGRRKLPALGEPATPGANPPPGLPPQLAARMEQRRQRNATGDGSVLEPLSRPPLPANGAAPVAAPTSTVTTVSTPAPAPAIATPAPAPVLAPAAAPNSAAATPAVDPSASDDARAAKRAAMRRQMTGQLGDSGPPPTSTTTTSTTTTQPTPLLAPAASAAPSAATATGPAPMGPTVTASGGPPRTAVAAIAGSDRPPSHNPTPRAQASITLGPTASGAAPITVAGEDLLPPRDPSLPIRLPAEPQPIVKTEERDTIYVENAISGAFKKTRIAADVVANETHVEQSDEIGVQSLTDAIEVFIPSGFAFANGILGGISILHFILGYQIFATSMETYYRYISFFPMTLQSVYLFLSTITLLSVIDKHFKDRTPLLRRLWYKKFAILFAGAAYLTVFVFSLGNITVDDEIRRALVGSETWYTSIAPELQSHLSRWRVFDLIRVWGAIVGWVCVSFDTGVEDFLTHNKRLTIRKPGVNSTAPLPIRPV